jgi:hypothetical protein
VQDLLQNKVYDGIQAWEALPNRYDTIDIGRVAKINEEWVIAQQQPAEEMERFVKQLQVLRAKLKSAD